MGISRVGWHNNHLTLAGPVASVLLACRLLTPDCGRIVMLTSHRTSSSILILSLYCPINQRTRVLGRSQRVRGKAGPFSSRLAPLSHAGQMYITFIPVVSKLHLKKTRQHAKTDVFLCANMPFLSTCPKMVMCPCKRQGISQG